MVHGRMSIPYHSLHLTCSSISSLVGSSVQLCSALCYYVRMTSACTAYLYSTWYNNECVTHFGKDLILHPAVVVWQQQLSAAVGISNYVVDVVTHLKLFAKGLRMGQGFATTQHPSLLPLAYTSTLRCGRYIASSS